jgi:hypothetical protein
VSADAPGIALPKGLSTISQGTGPNQPQVSAVQPARGSVTTTVAQTTEFMEASEGELLSFPEGGANGAFAPIEPSIDLGRFLQRPVQIASFTWNTGWADTTIYPWQLYFTNTEVAKKLSNFPFIRGKLKLKFVINSSPFYYGAMRAIYEPMAGYNSTRVSTFGGSSLIPFSQYPGIFLYPQTSTGGVMELPFFYWQDYLALTEVTAIQQFGSLRMLQYVPLRSANGASSSGVTISVYAWMEDVQLAGFTSQPILQSDSYVEDHNGPVSAPANMLSKAAAYLVNVPVIGKFALATKIGASAVARVASLFGWSNTPVISPVMPMKNLPFHDLASAEISQPVSKFSLDPKAELSVSPYMVGLEGDDELSIPNLVQRQSFLTSFTWNTTDPANTLFFSSLVNPLLYDRGVANSSGTWAIQQTPLSWLARCFRYWRGDLIFTFRIIASPFHRGRLRIHWEPYGQISSVTDVSHTTLTQVVDIESSTEIEFRVPYLQPVPWLEQTHQGDIYAPNKWSTSSVQTPSKGDDNGALVVRCLNILSAPVDTAPITVMVFVRGAENVQFANPVDGMNKFSYLPPQSDSHYETNQPDETYIKNWGEPIVSLRKLLRRSQLVDLVPMFLTVTATDLAREYRLPMSKYPPMPGYSALSYETAASVTGTGNPGFNYTNMNSFCWIAPAYLALRGSMRWHFNVINKISHGPSSVALYRDPGVTISAPTVKSLAGSSFNTTTLFKNMSWSANTTIGAAGLVLTNYEGQPGLSAELPMMIPYKFYINRFDQWMTGSSTDKSNGDLYKFIVRTVDSSTSQTMALERYTSIGTDFNAHFFLGVPTVYYNALAGA